MVFYIIAAITQNRGIGFHGVIPWHLKKDLKYFRELTMDAAIIMGRHTYLSLPHSLKRRTYYVVTSHQLPMVTCCTSLDNAITIANKLHDKVFIIGGGQLYEEAITRHDCKKLYITEINADIECDTFFPEIPSNYIMTSKSALFEENGLQYRFVEYTKCHHRT